MQGTTLLAPLTAPTGVSATDNLPYSIRITWNPVLGASSYEVLLDFDPDGGFKADPIGSTSHTYIEVFVMMTDWVYFKVRARDGSRSGPRSAAVKGRRTG